MDAKGAIPWEADNMVYQDTYSEVNMNNDIVSGAENDVMRAAAEAPPGDRLDIKVCNPVKQDQGINAYITYKVWVPTLVEVLQVFVLPPPSEGCRCRSIPQQGGCDLS